MGSPGNVSEAQATGRATEKCGTPEKRFHETGPQALHQKGKTTSRWASKMPLQLPLAVGDHYGHVSPREMGLAFILKFCVYKKISVGSAKYAKHIRTIDFKSLMQLFFFPLMIKNMVTSTFGPFTHQAPLAIFSSVQKNPVCNLISLAFKSSQN